MADNYAYSNVSIYNPVTGHTISYDNDIKCSVFKENAVVDEYVVTEADVLAALNNGGNLAPQSIQVSCSGDRGTIDIDSSKNFLNVYAENLIADYYDPFVSISCAMSASSKSSVGDVCHFSLTVANLTKTVVNELTFNCSLGNDPQVISLQPEGRTTFTYDHSITEDDLYAKKVVAAASATGTSFAGTPINVSVNNPFTIGSADPKISLVYTDVSTGLSRGEYSYGDEITYKATATNSGNVTLYSIEFHDSNSGSTRTSDSLAPGASVEWTFSKTFQDSNVIEDLTGTISAKNRNNAAASATVQPLKCYVDYSISGWAFKVQVDSSTSNRSSIPFSLFNQPSIELLVDWGDGTSDLIDPSRYEIASSSFASVHQYSSAGEYTIQVDSNDWDNTYIFSYGTSYNTSGTNTSDQYACIGYFKSTVVEILNPIPGLKGTNCYSSSTSYATSTSRIGNPFQSCSKLTSIPEGLFSNLPSTFINFSYCFAGCSSLQEIPAGLFDNFSGASSFQQCFYGCSSLTAIPEGLFDSCTANTVFWSCFQNCSSLQTIPEYLFAYNTVVNDFDECFSGCTSLGSFNLHIGATSITYCSNFVTYKSGTTRNIYVPSGSTTQTKFNSVASSLGLTIIGE